MKKIIIAETLRAFIEKEKNYMQRADIKLFTEKSNDEILNVHRSENVNLIITQLDMPGIPSDQLFTSIRSDRDLRKVSLIMFCLDNPTDRKRAERCNPNSILTFPVNTVHLLERARHLLNVQWRESYRVLLSVAVDGNNKERPFFCRSENISVTGLLLETERSLGTTDRLTCSFFLPDSKQITVTGEIVRIIKQQDKSEAKRYGVKFDKLTPEAKGAIEAFVQKKAQKTR